MNEHHEKSFNEHCADAAFAVMAKDRNYQLAVGDTALAAIPWPNEDGSRIRNGTREAIHVMASRANISEVALRTWRSVANSYTQTMRSEIDATGANVAFDALRTAFHSKAKATQNFPVVLQLAKKTGCGGTVLRRHVREAIGMRMESTPLNTARPQDVAAQIAKDPVKASEFARHAVTYECVLTEIVKAINADAVLRQQFGEAFERIPKAERLGGARSDTWFTADHPMRDRRQLEVRSEFMDRIVAVEAELTRLTSFATADVGMSQSDIEVAARSLRISLRLAQGTLGHVTASNRVSDDDLRKLLEESEAQS